MVDSTNTNDVTDAADVESNATELLQKIAPESEVEGSQEGGKKYKQTRGKKGKKGKKSKKVKKPKRGKTAKKAKKAKKAKTAKRSGKKNYLSFCAMYAKKHGFPNARAVMKNPQCKAAFRAQ